MPDTMKIWNAVSKTDPSHTKHVNQRGGFTAIAAHSQIMKATEQFGPVGEGWGYDCGAPVFHDKFIMIPVTIWHGTRGNAFGPILGCAEMMGNRPDSDAPKKAMTDAITKGLSQLGFNADVFLGMFDDNKYVQERTREAEKEKAPQPTPAEIESACANLKKCTDLNSLQVLYTGLFKSMNHIATHADVIAAKDAKKAEFEGAQ